MAYSARHVIPAPEVYRPRAIDAEGTGLLSVTELGESDRTAVLAFLSSRAAHAIVMAGFITDNGIESELNRGTYVGCRDAVGQLEGVALVGHTTMVEARTERALLALAAAARSSLTQIHVIMSDGENARRFWRAFSERSAGPRRECKELQFEAGAPFSERDSEKNVRQATIAELMPIAQAQAELALMESGIDPMKVDREGFLRRVARRIGQGRTFVLVEDGDLVFKADVMAKTEQAIYLEGIYVAPGHRGGLVGSQCLRALTSDLLKRVDHICLLSNEKLGRAHSAFQNAGYRLAGECITVFN